MSMQAYLDNIQAKTGKTVEDFRSLAAEKGLVSYREINLWLKSEFGLGGGHANLVSQLLANADKMLAKPDDKLDGNFAGLKGKWRPVFDTLNAQLQALGEDYSTSPTRSYISLLRNGKKFGIVEISAADHIDIGIKLKGAESSDRFSPAGSWNAMMTHRVRINTPGEIDKVVLEMLKRAYAAVQN